MHAAHNQPDSEAHLPNGMCWHEQGSATYGGDALELYNALRARFEALAGSVDAAAMHVPSTLSVDTLMKVNYLASFPHHANFVISSPRDEASLAALGKSTEPQIEMQGKVDQVLTPAACYHIYPCLEDAVIEEPLRFLTLETNCFRCEERYTPLRRHWSFAMREIVLVGEGDEVARGVERLRAEVLEIAKEIGIEARFESASDPFFNAASNPQALAQRLGDLKQELIYGEDLAIASTNIHGEYFSRAFNIKATSGALAHTACVAFGIERWMHAVIDTYGAVADAWPQSLVGDADAC